MVTKKAESIDFWPVHLLNPIPGMAYGLGVLLLALIMWRMP